MTRSGRRARVGTIAALALLGAVAYGALVAIDEWARGAFARPILASALVAVIDVAVLVLALCLAPALSRLVAGRPD